MPSQVLRCDIFCTVIDNFGDAGICWRLARQLAMEHGWQVRLLIDNPAVLARLAPDHLASAVRVRFWDTTAAPVAEPDWPPARVVIEAFGCPLPDAYLHRMAEQTPPPVWVNLEYLTAEAWIDGCHGLPSPHPQLPLQKHFFFPGFSTVSGGLLHEADYKARRAAFDRDAWAVQHALPPPRPGEKTLSLFSYPAAPRVALIQGLVATERPVTVLLPGSGEPAATAGQVRLQPLPFLPQPDYDALLWYCDANFVRGEDSFVRAQLAGKPMIWNIYPQEDEAHRAKLEAFLARYPAAETLGDLFRWWNHPADFPAIPGRALEALFSSRSHDATAEWASHLLDQTDLAAQLVSFCAARIE